MVLSETMAKKVMAEQVIKNALFWMKTASAQQLGALGEIYARWWFILQGFDAHDTSGLRHQGDIALYKNSSDTPIRVEVKTAKPDREGVYQFCLRKTGKTDISHSNQVLLLAMDDNGKLYRYLVPRKVFGDRRKCAITSHPERYSGKLSKFLVN